MAGTYTAPSAGEKRTTGDKKAREALEGFNALLDGSNKIPGTSLAAAAEILNAQLKGEITDAKLASPNNSFYRTLLSTQAAFVEATVAGTYALDPQQQPATKPLVSGSNFVETSKVTSGMPVFLQFAKADYEVAGKTQKLRLRVQALVNATKPTIKFTVGMYPVTVAGAANNLTITLGTVVSGSTVEVNEPAASTATSATGSDFTIPSDGVFMLGCVTSGTLTANSVAVLAAQLQTRSV